MFGLLGPNGAGKTTLMRSVATLSEPDQGEILFQDLDVRRQKDDVRRILGYLPQEFGVYPRMSALDLLDHLAVLKGFTATKPRRELVDHLLRLTNLWDVRKRKLGTFSGGMRQRFGIAQALIGDPRLIIVDEPTAGLDPEERSRFLALLSDIGEDVVVVLSRPTSSTMWPMSARAWQSWSVDRCGVRENHESSSIRCADESGKRPFPATSSRRSAATMPCSAPAGRRAGWSCTC